MRIGRPTHLKVTNDELGGPFSGCASWTACGLVGNYEKSSHTEDVDCLSCRRTAEFKARKKLELESAARQVLEALGGTRSRWEWGLSSETVAALDELKKQVEREA